MHPVLKGQHAWVNTSHSYQTFKHTGPQAFEFVCFRQHCWSQLHVIPDEDEMCVSGGQLERNGCHRLCRLSSLVHHNELTGPVRVPVRISQAISKVPITTSVLSANCWLCHALLRFLALGLLFIGSQSSSRAIAWEEICLTRASLILSAGP